MLRQTARVIAGLITCLLLGGASCGADDSAPDPTKTPVSASVAAVSYDTFLAVLAENGWTPTEDDKHAGSTRGVQVYSLECAVRLALVTSTQLDYKITSINAYDPPYFGGRVEAELGKENITKGEFESILSMLIAAREFEPC